MESKTLILVAGMRSIEGWLRALRPTTQSPDCSVVRFVRSAGHTSEEHRQPLGMLRADHPARSRTPGPQGRHDDHNLHTRPDYGPHGVRGPLDERYQQRVGLSRGSWDDIRTRHGRRIVCRHRHRVKSTLDSRPCGSQIGGRNGHVATAEQVGPSALILTKYIRMYILS